MKLFHLASLLALFCTSAGAWTNVPAGPPTVNVYTQQQPDYAANVSNGFSKMADALKQYEAAQPTPKPTPTGPIRVGDRVTWPDGSYGVIVDNQIFLTKADGQKGVCTIADSRMVDCKAR